MHQALWIVSFIDEGKSTAIGESCGRLHGFDACRSLNKALKPTSKARGVALLGAATTWPACSMNSVLQPQLLKLEEVFDETVKSGVTIQDELKSAILLRCVGGQLKSYLNLTIGDNAQYSTLREQVLQWDRSQQKWATSMVASSSTNYQGPMPMDIDRVQDTKEKGKKVRKARMTIKRAKVKMPRANERKDKEIRKERKVITRAKEKERPERQRCGNIVHLWKARTYC